MNPETAPTARPPFEAIVTAADPPSYNRHGRKVTLFVWVHKKYGSDKELKDACAPLLSATPGLRLASSTSAAAKAMRAMMERDVEVFTPEGLRNAKMNLARSVQTYLGMATTIQ